MNYLLFIGSIILGSLFKSYDEIVDNNLKINIYLLYLLQICIIILSILLCNVDILTTFFLSSLSLLYFFSGGQCCIIVCNIVNTKIFILPLFGVVIIVSVVAVIISNSLNCLICGNSSSLCKKIFRNFLIFFVNNYISFSFFTD